MTPAAKAKPVLDYSLGFGSLITMALGLWLVGLAALSFPIFLLIGGWAAYAPSIMAATGGAVSLLTLRRAMRRTPTPTPEAKRGE